MLNWVNRFDVCVFLDTHQYLSNTSDVECLAAGGVLQSFSAKAGNAFNSVADFYNQQQDWLFGHLAYDLKNEIEDLESGHPDKIGFDDMFFFVPEVIMKISGNELQIGVRDGSHGQHYDDLLRQGTTETIAGSSGKISVYGRIDRDEYIRTINLLRQHILRGDCYELNFCQEFYATVKLYPLQLYQRLSRNSPNPFSAFYRNVDRYALCASPERYLTKKGNRLFSQPIKGTAPRDLNDKDNDRMYRLALENSQKERSENIMVVDLVRNDLSRICRNGTVKVDELCRVYAFPQVFQMISTVSGEIRPDATWTDALKATFPMGSMTGAPKKSVMQLIEKYERSARGLFSGSIGYVDPAGNFDFNVVIRTVLYNQKTAYLSFQAGSAITYNCDPEAEYEECQLKAEVIRKALIETPVLPGEAV